MPVCGLYSLICPLLQLYHTCDCANLDPSVGSVAICLSPTSAHIAVGNFEGPPSSNFAGDRRFSTYTTSVAGRRWKVPTLHATFILKFRQIWLVCQ
ncbi:hypothetical protein F5B18DRAFT_604039 [Nemania serpens]|nr:hypothetical protein F5B18DRAFT_604039 [Nemania serpens]